MTNVVILPKSAEPEASTSVSANRGLQANQNNNQEFSKTFAASLEQHTKRAAVQRNQRQAPAANAPDHAAMDNVDKHDRVQVADAGDTQRKPADATGRSLPESGKRLQDKKSPSHAEDSAAVPVQSDAQPVQAPDAVQTAVAISEQTVATVIDRAAQQAEPLAVTELQQAAAVTAAAPQDTLATDTDAAPLSPPPTSPELPEQTTLQQGAADGIAPDSLSTAAESTASPAGLITSVPVQPAADNVATPDSPLPQTSGSATGPSATALRARNPQLTDPGLARQNTSALSAMEDEATATAAESVKRVAQGTPAQQSAQAHNLPAQPFSEQIKQWFDARQSLTSASDGVAADIREGKSGALQTNNPVKLSAVNLEAMNPDELRRFNNHLLFERLMSAPWRYAAPRQTPEPYRRPPPRCWRNPVPRTPNLPRPIPWRI